MKQLNILLLLIATIISSTVLAGNSEGSIPDFKDLTGKGIVKEYSYGALETTSLGKLVYIEDYTVTGKTGCRGLQLWSSAELLGIIAFCKPNNYFICGRERECDPTDWDAKVDGNIVQQYFETAAGTELNFLMEIDLDRLIYRIQERNCLIEGPHAMCFFEGFSWEDAYTKKFQRN